MPKFILYVLLSFWMINTANAQNCTIKLTGHVEDADLKGTLTGATVSIIDQGKELVTDSTGDFIFYDLCPGEYTLLITHVDCEPLQQKIKIDRNKHVDLYLPHARRTLGEVVVAGKKELIMPGFKAELDGKKLDQTRGQTLAEALSHLNGINMLQTGSTVAKPVIHGLHSNRVLMINNGVRQEGQQWGTEHAPEIDPFIADRLLVIKGVDELKYGSDAIGGVILVEPRALINKVGYAGDINTGYFTNNRQYVAAANFEQRLSGDSSFAYRVQGTYKRSSNVNTPNYRLNNTGTEEINFSGTLGWRHKGFATELFYSQFATKLGIFTGSHIGNLTDLQKAIASPKPDDIFLGQQTYHIGRPYQDVVHQLLKSKSSWQHGAHKFNLLLAGQYDHRREFDIVRNTSNTKPQLDLGISTLSEDLSWEQPKKNNVMGIAGLSAMQQDNSYSGRYFIPNYYAYTFGGYYIEKWSKHNWDLEAGVRYDNKSIQTTRLRFNGNIINHDFNFSTFAGSTGATYRTINGWKFNAAISLSTRAPYVNELLSDGIHDGTATYEKGDIDLSPERALNFSGNINYEQTDGRFGLDLNAYSNHIHDFIYQQPVPYEPVLTIAGAFPLIEFRQTNAVLNGFDVAGSVRLLKGLEYVPKFSVLYARDTKQDDWLIWMPANRLTNELTYNFNDGKTFTDAYLSASVVDVMHQDRVPGKTGAAQDYKEAPDAYTVVDCNASATLHFFKVPLIASVSVRNLFNNAYRDYLNRFRYYSDEMGRNIGFRLRVPFGTHKS